MKEAETEVEEKTETENPRDEETELLIMDYNGVIRTQIKYEGF